MELPRLDRAINDSSMPGWLKGVLGTLTQKTTVPPFIVTLAGMLIIRGVALWISQGQPRLAPKAFGVLGQDSIGPIPIPVIVTVIVYVVCYFILTRTKFGRSVYAVGGNQEVSRLSGISGVVLPRELTIDEIKQMAAVCPRNLSLEVFVHGALCYGVSGRCYWSSYLGGKSGLRGRCVQPCRRMYAVQKISRRSFSIIPEIMTAAFSALMTKGLLSRFSIMGVSINPG